MTHDNSNIEQARLRAQDPCSRVATVLVCQSTLIRSGIYHILSDTRFTISREPLEQWSVLPILCLIHADQVTRELNGTIKRLKTQWPAARVILLSDHVELAPLASLFQEGLDGICSTTMKRESLIKAFELVMLGETFIPAASMLCLFRDASSYQHHNPNGAATFMAIAGSAAEATAPKLSGREAQILRCLTQGASNKDIARRLGLAEATVKIHLKAILRKVRVANRTQAAMWARQHMNLAANDGFLDAAE